MTTLNQISDEICRILPQGCQQDLKLPGKYNNQVGNQTARDFFWFYFSCFPMKVAKGHVRNRRGKFLIPSS